MSHQGKDPQAASIRHMRETAEAWVENASLRQVAREIGMSPTGLRKFLDGTSPYGPTIRRLRAWYVRHALSRGSEIEPITAGAAVDVLTHELGARERRDAAIHVLDAVGNGYAQSGKPAPAWVSELKTQYAAA